MKSREMSNVRQTHIESGCNLWHDCFTCPFPECRIDGKRVLLTLKAREEADQLAREGHNEETIAKKLGKSSRTIKRWLGKDKCQSTNTNV